MLRSRRQCDQGKTHESPVVVPTASLSRKGSLVPQSTYHDPTPGNPPGGYSDVVEESLPTDPCQGSIGTYEEILYILSNLSSK